MLIWLWRLIFFWVAASSWFYTYNISLAWASGDEAFFAARQIALTSGVPFRGMDEVAVGATLEFLGLVSMALLAAFYAIALRTTTLEKLFCGAWVSGSLLTTVKMLVPMSANDALAFEWVLASVATVGLIAALAAKPLAGTDGEEGDNAPSTDLRGED